MNGCVSSPRSLKRKRKGKRNAPQPRPHRERRERARDAVRLSDTASSSVVAARRVHDARECAIKRIRKSRCRTARDAARIGGEVAVLRRLRHPSIVPLLECWQSADHVCLVFPRHDTDLFDFSTPHRDGMPVE